MYMLNQRFQLPELFAAVSPLTSCGLKLIVDLVERALLGPPTLGSTLAQVILIVQRQLINFRPATSTTTTGCFVV